jgi:hypothetical protein
MKRRDDEWVSARARRAEASEAPQGPQARDVEAPFFPQPRLWVAELVLAALP